MNQGFPANQGQQNRQPPVSGWQAASAFQPGTPLQQPPPAQQQPGASNTGRTPPPRKQAPFGKIAIFLLLAAILALGGIWGVNALRDKQVAQSLVPYAEVFPPNMFVNDVPLAGLTPLSARDRLIRETEDRINSWTLSVEYQGFVFTNLNYSDLGIQADPAEFEQLLNQAWLHVHQGTIHQQKAAIDALGTEPLKLYSSQKELESSRLRGIMEQIAPYINASPVDAAILEFRPDEAQPFIFQDERFGASLDIDQAIADIMEMANSGVSGSYQLAPQVLEPEVTRSQLAETVALRTSITTAISTSSEPDRNYNIMLSLQKFNGTILRPGQVFSFNDIVGPRTEEAGFRPALEYAYGDLVYGIGGGVCQASTTLYQAALTAGLSIVKRYPHSGAVDYTQLGQDATVYLTRDRNLDFQFRNTTAGSIYITAHVKPVRNNSKRLVAAINIYGLSLGYGMTYKLRSDIVQVLPPPVEKKYESDKEGLYVTYTDEEKLKTKAVEGQVIETYLEKYQNGVLVEQPQLLTSDTFKAKPAVYWRGINKRDAN